MQIIYIIKIEVNSNRNRTRLDSFLLKLNFIVDSKKNKKAKIIWKHFKIR